MKPRPSLALGLMSGTSADGLSLALIKAGGKGKMRLLKQATYAYPKKLRLRILAAPGFSAKELSLLNFELGRLYADYAERFLKEHGIPVSRIAVAGSHGQTIVHLPGDRVPSTLQIGEPSFLAERLNAPVVSDFRPRDMSVGGQGAPLIPFLDEFLFGDGPARALQNIGGISNVALVGKGLEPLAFDTGPGNCLIDLAVAKISKGRKSFDEGGLWAARGTADDLKVRELLRLPYFRRRPPKSLDRETFGERFLKERFGAQISSRPWDVLATLTDFTAAAIEDACRRFLYPNAKVQEMIVSGGGALNRTLMKRLKLRLFPVPVRSIEELGIPPQAKEPAAFALMAWRALQGAPNHSSRTTGARYRRVLGKVTLPAKPFRFICGCEL